MSEKPSPKVAEKLKEGESASLSEEFFKLGYRFVPIPKVKQQGFIVSGSTVTKTRSLIPLVFRNKGHEVFNDKHATRQLLVKHGFSAPSGKLFDYHDKAASIEYFKNISSPCVVLKPNNMKKGEGVTTEIKTLDLFMRALDRIPHGKTFLVEDHIQGQNFRVFVVLGKVVAVTRIEPANVVGDGASSVEELIHKKNQVRLQNSRLRNRLIPLDERIDSFLSTKDRTRDFVPADGQIVQLLGAANTSVGSDNIDVTEHLHPDFQGLFSELFSKLCSNRVFVGIDMIARDISCAPDRTSYSIIEVNGGAAISHHSKPSLGFGRNVEKELAKAYIEHYGNTFKRSRIFVLRGRLRGIKFRQACEKIGITHQAKLNVISIPLSRYVVLSVNASDFKFISVMSDILSLNHSDFKITQCRPINFF